MITPDQVIANIRARVGSAFDGEATLTAEEVEEIATLLAEYDTMIVFEAAWKSHRDELLGQLAAAEAERDALLKALEDMGYHVDKLTRCVRVNDEMGRVVTGQTEAITALAEIHARTLAGDNHE